MLKSFLISVTILVMGSVSFGGGNENGSGGDSYAIEFQALSKEFLQTLKEKHDSPVVSKWHLNLENYSRSVQGTLVRSQENLILDSQAVDAIKFPDGNPDSKDKSPMIILNRNRWRNSNLVDKLRLVVHEYFGIMKLEINDSTVSTDFSDLIVATFNRIRSSALFLQSNQFYGYGRLYGSLSQMDICDSSNVNFSLKYNEVKEEALGKCKLVFIHCDIEVHFEPVIDPSLYQARYCEFTSVATGVGAIGPVCH